MTLQSTWGSMSRGTEIIVDGATWPRSSVPPEIAGLAGPRTTSLLLALLHTAICTRPPEIHGFHLSDFWAFLRYAFAFAPVQDLRLRAEWSAVDPHQKAVLSDELGVGFTTELLAQACGCRNFSDTLYVVNVLEPKKFSLLSSAKNGPKKSPDYIALDSSGNYYVLECKGTQASRRALTGSLKSGRAQKINLTSRSRTVIKHSLVCGLFIPQYESGESSCIKIADPSWNELADTLVSHPRSDIDAALSQISLAKNLALAGLVATPNILARAPVNAEHRLSPEARAELSVRRDTPSVGMELIFDTATLRAGLGTEPLPMGRARFSAEVPDRVLRLADADELEHEVREFAETSRGGQWAHVASEHRAEVRTPLGFRYCIELD